jgi:hypothetical protein
VTPNRTSSAILAAMLLAAMLLAGCATTTPTGPMLGHFLDQGAKQLSKAQYTGVMSERVVTGPSDSGKISLNLTFESNGTMSGTVTAISGQSAGAISRSTGTWTISEDGKFCLSEHLVDWNIRHSECNYMFVLGDEAIKSESATDRSVRTTVRKIPASDLERFKSSR